MTLFACGFRPFFALAGGWAVAAVGLWVLRLHGLAWPGAPADALGWHVHEMVFGFAGAAVAGFLLTAMANFTGRDAVRGTRLALLVVAWYLGRLAVGFSGMLPDPMVAVADLLFPAGFAFTVAYELVAARNWRNLPLAVVVALFALTDVGYHLAGATPIGSVARALYGLAPHLLLVLIVVLGGRITPAFSRNWLLARGETALPVSRGWVERCVVPASVAVGLAAVLAPAWLAVACAVAVPVHALRLAGWRGWAVRGEPLLLVLHAGFAWMVVGYAFMGFAAVGWIPSGAAFHALTAGAIGTMIVGVSSRVVLGHTGRPLAIGRITVATYLLVGMATVLRIASAWAGDAWLDWIGLSAVTWMLAWLLYLVVYLPMMLSPRIDGRPG